VPLRVDADYNLRKHLITLYTGVFTYAGIIMENSVTVQPNDLCRLAELTWSVGKIVKNLMKVIYI